MTTLFCDKKGDHRFWDEVASIDVSGVQNTIANHFKNATETDELIIGGYNYEKKYARSFYNLMWVKYLDRNPALVQEASKYRKYSGNAADVIRTYIKESRAAVMQDEDMVALIKQMNANKSANTPVNTTSTNVMQQPINIDENIISIALTGHRPEKLDGYNLYTPFYIELAKQLRSIVLGYLSAGKKVHMITGMALGADTLWALVGLKLKQQGYSVTLEAAIPCAEHYSRWKKEDQDRWHDIVKKADKVTYVSNKPYKGYLMQKRNEYMVDQCDALISVWDGTEGGTKNCLDYMAKCMGYENGINDWYAIYNEDNRSIIHKNIDPNKIKEQLSSSLVYINGDLLKSDCNIIMHQANCQSVMNAGIAKSICAMYPDVRLTDKCDPRSPQEKLGDHTAVVEDNRTIVNLYGQFGYGVGVQHTNYGALESALRSFLQTVNGTPKIGVPYNMGCGLAGGDWKVVESILDKVAKETGHKIHIYKLN